MDLNYSVGRRDAGGVSAARAVPGGSPGLADRTGRQDQRGQRGRRGDVRRGPRCRAGRRGQVRGEGTGAPGARRRPGRGEGGDADRRQVPSLRLPADRRQRRDADAADGPAPDRRRCGPAPADHDAGVLDRRDHPLRAVGRHTQSMEPRLQPRRFVGRLGCGIGCRTRPTGHRLRHRGLHPGSVGSVWRRRVPTPLRTGAVAAAAQSRHLLSGRADGPHGH